MNRPAPATRANRWPPPTRAGGRDVRRPVGPAWWRRVEIDRTLGGGGFAQPRPQPGPDLLRRVGPALPLAAGDHHAAGGDAHDAGQADRLPPPHPPRPVSYTHLTLPTK